MDNKCPVCASICHFPPKAFVVVCTNKKMKNDFLLTVCQGEIMLFLFMRCIHIEYDFVIFTCFHSSYAVQFYIFLSLPLSLSVLYLSTSLVVSPYTYPSHMALHIIPILTDRWFTLYLSSSPVASHYTYHNHLSLHLLPILPICCFTLHLSSPSVT